LEINIHIKFMTDPLPVIGLSDVCNCEAIGTAWTIRPLQHLA